MWRRIELGFGIDAGRHINPSMMWILSSSLTTDSLLDPTAKGWLERFGPVHFP